MNLSAGARLGPYEVVSRIGAGGMGEVWKARDTRLDRSVAVKVLAPSLAADGALRARLEREARIVSRLEHPHICRLYDVGDDYLVMELVEGETLADRLARGPLPLPEVVRFGAQIAEALDRAHRAGIVHRDLKPGNVMLTRSGVKLLDFGLAKPTALAEPATQPSPLGETVAPPLTEKGTLLGTFQYMAPEQLEGEESDPRTDIFALGAVLYEMVTGRRAFEGKTRTSLIAAIVKEQPRPLAELQPLAPPALDHVIQRCLAKEPDERWQSARDVAEELRWIAEAGSQAGVAPVVASRRRSRERMLWAAAVLAVAGWGLAGALHLQSRRPGPVYSFTVPRIDTNYSYATDARVSPDGSEVCFVARTSDDKPSQVFVRALASLEARPLAGSENATGVAWSADGRSIVFFAENRVKSVDLESGAVRTLADGGDVVGLATTRGGDLLLGSAKAGVRRIPAGGGRPEVLTRPDRARHEIFHSHPTMLPGEKWFLFTSFVRDPARTEQPRHLYARSLATGETRNLGEIPSRVEYVEPGFLLFVRDGTLLAAPFDAGDLKFAGEPVTLADDVYYFKPTGEADFSASRRAVITYRAPFRGESLAWFDGAGRREGTIGPVGQWGAFRIAPGGATVAAALVDPKIGTQDLWSFGTQRSTASRLTFGPGFESNPVLSPDGALLFYASDRFDIPDIFVKELGSASDDRRFLAAPGEQVPNDVSPDGRFLLYQSNDYSQSKNDLFVVPVTGAAQPTPFLRTPSAEWGGRFSPDGRWVAYMSDESGKAQVYVKPFPGPGAPRQISTDRGWQPRWSGDGRRLYFRGVKQLFVWELDRPEAEPRLLFEAGQIFDSFEVAPDGERFLLSVYDELAAQNPTRVIVNWPELLRQRAAARAAD